MCCSECYPVLLSYAAQFVARPRFWFLVWVSSTSVEKEIVPLPWLAEKDGVRFVLNVYHCFSNINPRHMF